MSDLNWYKQHLDLNDLKKGIISDINSKEAGVVSNLSAIMLAVSLYLGGTDIASAADKAGVSVEEVSKAIKNKDIVNKAKSNPTVKPDNKAIVPDKSKKTKNVGVVIQKPSLSDIVSAIVEHEGLIPKQTPFRITNEKMKKWKKIYGFDIDHGSKPANRKNFIFLKDPKDVVPAVEKCLINYANNPSKYGLNEKSTLKDILMKFDQTGSAGKIKFLQSKFPKLNVDEEFNSFVY